MLEKNIFTFVHLRACRKFIVIEMTGQKSKLCFATFTKTAIFVVNSI